MVMPPICQTKSTSQIGSISPRIGEITSFATTTGPDRPFGCSLPLPSHQHFCRFWLCCIEVLLQNLHIEASMMTLPGITWLAHLRGSEAMLQAELGSCRVVGSAAMKVGFLESVEKDDWVGKVRDLKLIHDCVYRKIHRFENWNMWFKIKSKLRCRGFWKTEE